jgi:hypothetical protein
MDTLIPNELEELIVCSCCHVTFNDSDAQPKLFSCRHYFCLKCISTILLKGKELYCIHCWKRTELPADSKAESLPTYNAILYLSQNMINIKAKKIINADQFSPTNISSNLANKIRSNENCPTHAMPNSLWCLKCNTLVCRACASTEDHRNHTVKSLNEAKETIHNDVLSELIKMQKKLTELQHLVFKQRDFLLKILEGCTTLKTQIETELINHIPTLEISDIRGNLSKAKLTLTLLEHQPSPAEAYRLFTSLNIEKQRLHFKYNEMLLQCKLEEIVQNNGSLLDFELLKQISSALNAAGGVDTIASSLNENQMILNALNNNITSIASPTVVITNNNNSTSMKSSNNSNSTQPNTPISSATSTNNNNIVNNNGISNNNNNPASPFNCSHVLASLGHNNMILLLANYCISQLYSHHILTTKTMAHALGSSSKSTSNGSCGSHNNNNNNNNNFFLNNNLSSGGIMLPEQMSQLSMHDHMLHKFIPETSNANNSSFLSADLLGSVSHHIGNGNVSNFISPNRQIQPISHHTPPPLNFIPDINGLVLQHHSLHSTANIASNNNNHTTTSATISTNPQPPTVASIVQNPSVHVYPIYFFNIEINGSPFGRVLIEVRNDVAPKMAKNFGSLCTGK